MTAILVAAASSAAFAATSWLGLFGHRLGSRARSMCVAVAGGILLALAFAEVFPTALALAPRAAVWGFLGGFCLLLLVEVTTRGHIHHSAEEPVPQHRVSAFLLGLGIHNLADGFALGASAELPSGGAAALAVGVLVHQLPVGLSLAAVLASARTRPASALSAVALLALAIPAAAALTTAVPSRDAVTAVVLAVAAGVLTYMSSAHLLPEAQREHHGAAPGLVFVATVLSTVLLLVAAGNES